MSEIVDLNRLTQRELLVRTHDMVQAQARDIAVVRAQLTTLNGTVREHDRTIAVLKTRQEERTAPSWLQSKPKVLGLGSLLMAIAALVGVAAAEFIKCLV